MGMEKWASRRRDFVVKRWTLCRFESVVEPDNNDVHLADVCAAVTAGDGMTTSDKPGKGPAGCCAAAHRSLAC